MNLEELDADELLKVRESYLEMAEQAHRHAARKRGAREEPGVRGRRRRRPRAAQAPRPGRSGQGRAG